MYESKYKYKHADRRVRLFPEKVETKPSPTPEASALQQSASFAKQFALQNQLDQQRQQQLSQFAQPYQQAAHHNQFGGIASMLGGGIFRR